MFKSVNLNMYEFLLLEYVGVCLYPVSVRVFEITYKNTYTAGFFLIKIRENMSRRVRSGREK